MKPSNGDLRLRSRAWSRIASIAFSLALIAAGTQAASGAPVPSEERVRKHGGPGDDVLIGKRGGDKLSGGAGDDIIIGDDVAMNRRASGSGNDKLNGGAGNDIIVGDAYSPVGATGNGNDDISGGPGNDELVGDALVGTYRRNGSGDARGFGNDEINGLPGTDLVVGDAAVHGTGTAYCGGYDKLNGEGNRSGGRNVSGLGRSIELIIGDCYSSKGSAFGAGSDRPIINGGDGRDVLVGDNYAPGQVKGRGHEKNMLGGNGNDRVYGDHHPVSRMRSGGGKDEPRGGDGNDKLFGGPSRDKCSGGSGHDKFATRGRESCEQTTGSP